MGTKDISDFLANVLPTISPYSLTIRGSTAPLSLNIGSNVDCGAILDGFNTVGVSLDAAPSNEVTNGVDNLWYYNPANDSD